MNSRSAAGVFTYSSSELCVAAAEQTLQLLVARKSNQNEACRIESQPQTKCNFIKNVRCEKVQALWSNMCLIWYQKYKYRMQDFAQK